MKKSLILVLVLVILIVGAIIFMLNCGNDNEIGDLPDGFTMFGGSVNVNGIVLSNAPTPLLQEGEFGDVLMLPIVAIAEELGYEIDVDVESETILVGDLFRLRFDVGEVYLIATSLWGFLETSPVLVSDIAFVPHSFFMWLGQNVRVHDNVIEIRTYSVSEFDWLTLNVAFATEEILRNYETYTEFIEFDEIGYLKILISSNLPVTDFRWIEIGHSDGDEFYFYAANELYNAGNISSDNPFVVTWVEWGTLPHRGISFVDSRGDVRYFVLRMNNAGYPEDPRDMYILQEFTPGAVW